MRWSQFDLMKVKVDQQEYTTHASDSIRLPPEIIPEDSSFNVGDGGEGVFEIDDLNWSDAWNEDLELENTSLGMRRSLCYVIYD